MSWPRVHAECDYKIPLHFEDEVEIHLLVAEIRAKALTYAFKFRKLNAAPPVQVARGALTVVCVRHEPDGRMAACAMPKLRPGQNPGRPIRVASKDYVRS